jgi:hypothetical protein
MLKSSWTVTTPLAWLLCIVILSASLDRVADPPAVKFHGTDTKALCLSHAVESVPGQSFRRNGTLGTVHFEPYYFGLNDASESDDRGNRATVMRQATDTSPPRHICDSCWLSVNI